MRALTLNLHDTSLGIWQDDPNDPTFRSEIFEGLLRQMKARKWKVTADPEVLKRHRCISPNYRVASRGELRAEISICGRHIELKLWAETWPIDNPNGHRYDFGKRDRLRYLDRLRVVLEFRRIEAWLRTFCAVTVTDRNLTIRVGRGGLTALEAIEANYATSWHSDKALGRPICWSDYNAKSSDGALIEHGATVWFKDHGGRIGRGTAYYHINNMWWVVSGRWARRNLGSHEIFVHQPADLRRKRNDRLRRERLERELARAIRLSNFRRAETLTRILFGDQPTFRIWARDNSAYYRANYSGYTTDTIAAGRYTREEAERECRRVPHELEMESPDGRRTRFDREAA